MKKVDRKPRQNPSRAGRPKGKTHKAKTFTLPIIVIEALEVLRQKTLTGKSTIMGKILEIALKPEIDLILEERKKNKKK